MSETIVVCRPGDLTVEVVERIAYARERFCLHESLLAVVATSSARTLSALASAGRIYGVNTGMGYLAAADVSEGERAEHQRSLLLGRAVGSGPFLPPPEARGLLLTRLVNFLAAMPG